MTAQPFTPAEIRDLGIIAARARMTADDNAPIVHVDYTGPERAERVIPWREAMELGEEGL